MKHFLILGVAAFVTFSSCTQRPTSDVNTEGATADSIAGWYGEEFEIGEVQPVTVLLAYSAEELLKEVVVEAEILHSCRKKGCWMKVDLGEGVEPMRVSFLDYGFFVPLVSDGRTAVMKGTAYIDTIDVDMLRHFAEDAGQTQEEIDAITEPEIEWSFEATGVYIR